MDSKPFFSIIVPAHNSQAYIRKGLESIREQTFHDYELIVVCDACTDDTALVARAYTDKVIITDHGMDGLARNAGIDAAEGEWLLFMDDDDWWLHPYVFELIRQKLLPINVDILMFGFLARNFLNNEGLSEYYNSRVHIWPAVWNKCYRREFIGYTRFPGIEFTSDLPFSNELLQKKPDVEFMFEPLYYYNYMRKGSQTEINARPDGAVPEA
jgi:glycosyltransferase involved in cell wall biosynthesis